MDRKKNTQNQENEPVLLPTSEGVEVSQSRGIRAAFRLSDDDSCFKIGCGLIFFFIFLGIILLVSSLKRLTSVEYGLQYDVFAKHLAVMADTGGLHLGPPFFKFIKFPSTFITADLADTCVSFDGLRVQFKVMFQYQITAATLLPVILKYRDYKGWAQVVEAAGNSAVQHTCSGYNVSEFQTLRGAIQAKMEKNLRDKLQGNNESPEGVHALAVSLQLRDVTLPGEYKRAVEEKQGAEEDIELAKNQRQQEVTKANTALLSAQETSFKILDTADNDANVTLTQAKLQAKEINFAFETEAKVLSDVKRILDLSTEGLLAYLSNQLFAAAPNLKVRAQEPTKISRHDQL